MFHIVHHPPQLSPVCACALDHRQRLSDGLVSAITTQIAPRRVDVRDRKGRRRERDDAWVLGLSARGRSVNTGASTG
eukprot:CAMPEP_0182549900 /NCGR_PEP_ID=MMETSP1323-20130603/40842_1 /TAXON_ID=236787 /ORGANISM="Florenciella parvula, Strain RCC1693" /LENGTH=76 /DNA_ID=CAMNT_0024761399 /DNA_START=280 /DNA_END=507 /DNA_ORIENTATION=+